MRTPVPIALLLIPLLTACGGWPDLPETQQRTASGTWPELLPEAALFPATEGADTGDDDAEALAARAEALRRRAGVLRTPVPDDAAFEALRARIGG